MSAHGMHPTFNDLQGYKDWRATWRRLYKQASAEITQEKRELKNLQRTAPLDEETRKKQGYLHLKRVMAHKMMTLLKDAKIRWKRIIDMQQQIADQNARFPLDLGKCQTIDFHFNKGHNEFPTILPMWILKAKGETFYINHVDFENVSFSTRELASGSTKGMLRFKHCTLMINKDGVATVAKHEEKVWHEIERVNGLGTQAA